MDKVWALVSDPNRRMEWDGSYYDIATVDDAGVLTTTTRRTSLDGKPAKVRPEFFLSRHVVRAYEPGTEIAREFFWPDRSHGAPQERFRRRLLITLHPDGAGTQIALTRSRVRAPGVLRWLLTPIYRFAIWQGLSARAGAIPRVLR